MFYPSLPPFVCFYLSFLRVRHLAPIIISVLTYLFSLLVYIQSSDHVGHPFLFSTAKPYWPVLAEPSPEAQLLIFKNIVLTHLHPVTSMEMKHFLSIQLSGNWKEQEKELPFWGGYYIPGILLFCLIFRKHFQSWHYFLLQSLTPKGLYYLLYNQ